MSNYNFNVIQATIKLNYFGMDETLKFTSHMCHELNYLLCAKGHIFLVMLRSMGESSMHLKLSLLGMEYYWDG
jgi:hypothetical protein